jgi:hypothetical protein
MKDSTDRRITDAAGTTFSHSLVIIVLSTKIARNNDELSTLTFTKNSTCGS